MPHTHPLDRATTLTRIGDDLYSGQTSTDYSNLGGPFGGVTAALLLRAVMEDERRRGTPIALTVNYSAAIANGAFKVQRRERRTGKSTKHWSLELTQGDRVGATASVVCGARRDVWAHQPAKPPVVPRPEELTLFNPANRSGWLQRYEFRYHKGVIDFGPRDPSELRDPTSILWMRDKPERPLDFISLAALSDAFIIRAFLVRAVYGPAGTVTLTTYFHTGEEDLAKQGTNSILGVATSSTFSGGFFDQTAQLWSSDGQLLATSMQMVWYRD